MVHVLEVVCCRLVSLIREPVTLSVAGFEAFSAAYQAHINVVVARHCEVGSFFDLCFVLVLQIHTKSGYVLLCGLGSSRMSRHFDS